ncbi:winged helix-turn-helix domain-containing protein [Rugosimonospora acidiphila]|uniref:winged helix-turn-helix domain-containing protein n=1 Tax=Rugosimonospora acidiphila TaxID=556531 RepID=UPI0031E4FA1B
MTSRPRGWRELAEQITEHIRFGRLRPGDRLPTEEALQDWTALSRTTIRTAIAELRRLGLVETRGRKGTFVLGFGGPYPLRPGESVTASAALIISGTNGATRSLPAGTQVVVDWYTR